MKKENSKYPLPIEVTPHVDKSFHIGASLFFKPSAVSGVEPLGQRILPCKLCLQTFKPAKYSSFGIYMAKFSPLTQG